MHERERREEKRRELGPHPSSIANDRTPSGHDSVHGSWTTAAEIQWPLQGSLPSKVTAEKGGVEKAG